MNFMATRSWMSPQRAAVAFLAVTVAACSGDDGTPSEEDAGIDQKADSRVPESGPDAHDASAVDASRADASIDTGGPVNAVDATYGTDVDAHPAPDTSVVVAPDGAAEGAIALTSDASTGPDVADGAMTDATDAMNDAYLAEHAVLDAGADAKVNDAPGDVALGCVAVEAGSSDPATLSAGAALINDHSCQGCHGYDFAGGYTINGAISKNLTPDPVTGLGCWTDQQIIAAMLYGTTPDGETLCVMPKWATQGFGSAGPFDAAAALQIVRYLRSVPAVSRAVLPTICPAVDAGSDAQSFDAQGSSDAQPRDASSEADASSHDGSD